MSYSARTRGLSKVRESIFGVTPTSPAMKEVRALNSYSFSSAPGELESQEMKPHRQTMKTRPGNKKGEFSIPFQFGYGDFDDLLEEVTGGIWGPVATVTTAITVAATGGTFTRATGSFLEDGFTPGLQIITSGFTSAGNNGTFVIATVTATVITVTQTNSLVDESGSGTTITTTADKLTIGNIHRSSTFEDRNPDADLYEQYNGCVLTGFDLAIEPEKLVTGTFKGIVRDCRIAGVTAASIAVASGGKTFTADAGGFLSKGAAFAVGDTIITSGFSNTGNNGTFIISDVTDTVITCATATGLVTEVGGSGKAIKLGTLGTPAPASDLEAYESYTGDLSEGSAVQTEVTGLKLSLENSHVARYVILTAGADAAHSITPDQDIKITGETSLFFEDQTFKKKFLAGKESSINLLLGTGIPGEKSMRIIMRNIQYTGNSRSTDNAIIETAPYRANYHTATGTALEIHRIP